MTLATNSELRAAAKAKGLLYEHTHGMYHAYIHITADDSDGLEGRSPDEYNVTIMTSIDSNTEQIAREAAKVIIKEMPVFEKNKKRRKTKKRLDKDADSSDNDSNELFESETETTSKRNLAARLKYGNIMKIAQFSDNKFTVVWFVWNPSTFRSLHPNSYESKMRGYNEFMDTNGFLKHKDVSYVTECRVTYINDKSAKIIGSGFSGCSEEDDANISMGMKHSLTRAIDGLKMQFYAASKEEIAKFYDKLFSEGTFGYLLKNPFTFDSIVFERHVLDKFKNLMNTIIPKNIEDSEDSEDYGD